MRDGGYVNKWSFSKKQVEDTILGLIQAKIEIIECGFLDRTCSYPYWSTRFRSVAEINQLFESLSKQETSVVAMLEYGKFDLDFLPLCDEASVIDGIRFSFRKSDWKRSIMEMQRIVDKGYKLFIQPITTNSYSQKELEEFLSAVDKLSPYAVYIVDTQGSMFGEDVRTYFRQFDSILSIDIAIGFHSHNNMQLSYSNAIDFVLQQTSRELIIDASIYGMGRGAGNLNTELFATYLQRKLRKEYEVDILWNLIDSYYHAMQSMFDWGYSIFHYLSASLACHPDYASYLLDKKHLMIKDIKKILEKIPKERSYEFDKEVIEDLYFSFNAEHKVKSREPIFANGERIILIGSGKNICAELERLKKETGILIALNHIPQDLKVDYVFFNSVKRFLSSSKADFQGARKIFSSNLNKHATLDDYVLDYQELTSIDDKTRSDNSAIMLINYFSNRGFKSVELAGIDGFSVHDSQNYTYQELDRVIDKKALKNINQDMDRCFALLKKRISIRFLTKTIFEIGGY